MKKKIELLAPGGDIDSIKAAILAGADAVYCGLDKFNARDRAKNISFDNLPGILRLAHKHNCEVFLTLNIIFIESEFPALIKLLNKLVNSKIDGIIVQDFGLFYLLAKYFPRLKIHASTQLTTHNEGQIKFLSKLRASRVNLSRELNIREIKDLTRVAQQNNILTEVFVHGSNCISFSGLCYMSSVNGGNSGNRGRCSQPCRDQYLTTAEGKDFPLNIKDNSAFSDLRALSDARVDSVKIEGRIKKYHYVYTVVSTWRKHLQHFYDTGKITNDNTDLRKVFNRDFSNSFLHGNIDRDIFIDNPRDNSALYFAQHIKEISITPLAAQVTGEVSCADDHLNRAKRELYDVKTEIISDVKTRIKQLSIKKADVIISVSGKVGNPLKVSVKTPETLFTLFSASELTISASSKCLNDDLILSRFKAINDTEYYIKQLDLDNLDSHLIIPFKELTAIKEKILFKLNGSEERIEAIDPIAKSLFTGSNNENVSVKSIAPDLCLLISSKQDLDLCEKTSADIYFELPNSFKNKYSEFVDLFSTSNSVAGSVAGKSLIPWFPSVLIGEDYLAAVDFLAQLQVKYIVTNNTGIAFEAYQKGISWIAGPYLNLVNSFSLKCLKEEFNCCGAFISNEINKNQIKSIRKPDNFQLIYSIYHPIVLMTSKACFFYQVTGCKKNIVDGSCIQRCEKSSLITNLKEISYFIKKSKGNYHTLYNQANFLNTDIVTDLPHFFSSLFIDLREIQTETKVAISKTKMIKLFESHLEGDSAATEELKQNINPSTNTQYKKGI